MAFLRRATTGSEKSAQLNDVRTNGQLNSQESLAIIALRQDTARWPRGRDPELVPDDHRTDTGREMA